MMKLLSALAACLILIPSVSMAHCPTAEQLSKVFDKAAKDSNNPNRLGFKYEDTMALDFNVFEILGNYEFINEHGDFKSGLLRLETKELKHEHYRFPLHMIIYEIQKALRTPSNLTFYNDSDDTCTYKATVPTDRFGTKIFELKTRGKSRN